ncbi:MAG: AI-2E family transporter [Lentimicrobium sp.]|nr:AI-2E family transporter [Lentimicrobium sp.]
MSNHSANNSVYDTTIRLFILILIVGWCLAIMYPFVSIILWSLILAMALHPLHKIMSEKMGGRPKLASAIIVLVVLVLVFLPTWLLIDSLIAQVKELKASFDSGSLTIPPPNEKVKDWPVIGEKLYDLWYNASVNLAQTAMKYKDQLIGLGSKIGSGILGAVGGMVQILISFILAAILLVFGEAGEEIRKFFRKVAGKRGDEFADMTLKTVGSVVKGIIGVALILALLNGVLFMLAGIPYSGIWTLVVFVLGILQLPLFFITVPIIAYMFSEKELVPAIIWTVLLLVAGLSDNVLKPILLGKGAPVPMLVIFIGVIGGFIFSGFIGLFTGAIVFSFGYKLFVAWINTNNLEEEA